MLSVSKVHRLLQGIPPLPLRQFPKNYRFSQPHRSYSFGTRDYQDSLLSVSIKRILGKNPPNQTPTWTKRLSKHWAKSRAIGGLLILLLPGIDISYSYYREYERSKILSSAFDRGSVPIDGTNNDSFIPRPEVTKTIEAILNPKALYKSYDLIVGSHGTGKTTLIRKIGHKSSGIIYVDIPQGIESFDEAFIDALKWTPPVITWSRALARKLFSTETQAEAANKHLFYQALTTFREAAKDYQRKYGRPAVLVFDNVNYLAQENPKRLWELQQIAKGAADRSEFVVVFVCSDGRAPAQMLEDPSRSRIGKTLEVPDLSPSQAFLYLHEIRHIPRQKAYEVYDIVGGRIKQLEMVADNLESGQNLPEIITSLITDAEQNFRKCGMFGCGAQENIGWVIAEFILRYGYIEARDYYRCFRDQEVADQMLASNVFTLRSGHLHDSVTFESKIVEAFARREIKRRKTWWGCT